VRHARPLALGCMRLSTELDRDETAAVAVLHAALDAGVTFLDTADAYRWSDEERGHNERLIARALSAWPGGRSAIIVATKGGMTRSGGRWVPDGRAKHLARAAENSRPGIWFGAGMWSAGERRYLERNRPGRIATMIAMIGKVLRSAPRPRGRRGRFGPGSFILICGAQQPDPGFL
jgi:hypothetical protein